MTSLGITDYHIQALVDNELDWEEQKQVLAFIREDRHALRRYNELCKQKQLLQQWWNAESKN